MVDFMQQGIQPYQPRSQGNNMLALLIQLKQLKQAESDRAYNRQRQEQADAISQARLDLAKADDQRAQERHIQDMIDVPLRRQEQESKIKMQEAQARAYETLAGISQTNVQRVDQATDPSQVADIFDATKNAFNSKSRMVGAIKKSVIDPVSEVLGPAKDALFKKIQTLDPLEKLAWGKGIVDENGPMRQHMDDTDLAKGYKAIKGSLDDLYSQVDTIPPPSDFALASGANPAQFDSVAESTISNLNSLEDFVRSEPAWVEGENAGLAQKTLNSISKKRQQYQRVMEATQNVMSANKNGGPETNGYGEDANLHYNTFNRKAVTQGPIEQAFAIINRDYRGANTLPSDLVADITGQAIEASPEALYRLSVMYEEMDRNYGSDNPIFTKIKDALSKDHNRFNLVLKARGFAEMTEGIAARESGTFDQYIQGVFKKAHTALKTHESVAFEEAVANSTDGEIIQGEFKPNLSVSLERMILEDKDLRSLTNWDHSSPAEKNEIRAIVGSHGYLALAKPGASPESAMAEVAAVMRDRFAKGFMPSARLEGGFFGPSGGNKTMFNPPSYIAKVEYGYEGMDAELLNRITYKQWQAEHPGRDPKRYRASADYGYEVTSSGDLRRRHGYVFTDENGAALKSNGEVRTWYPDLTVPGLYKSAEGDKDLTEKLDRYFGVESIRREKLGDLRGQSRRLSVQMHEVDKLLNSFNEEDRAKGRALKKEILQKSKSVSDQILEFQQISSLGVMELDSYPDFPPEIDPVEGIQ